LDFLSVLSEISTAASMGTFILTRRPKERWHRESVRVLAATGRTVCLENDRLHTKLYILECDGFRYVMFGSPNLTASGDKKNIELSMEFRTTMSDRIALIVDDFVRYASQLCSDPEARMMDIARL
jgi:hypothetical protein